MTINQNITREEVEELEAYVQPFLKDEALKGIALNLAKVNHLDSSGIGPVVIMLKTLRQRGAELVLYHLNEKNLKIITMIQLNNRASICGLM